MDPQEGLRAVQGRMDNPKPDLVHAQVQFIWIECFHSRGQHLCKFIGTKESVCIRKKFNSHRIGLGHQHGRCFIVLGHQYGRRDVMWKQSIGLECMANPFFFFLVRISRAIVRARDGIPIVSTWQLAAIVTAAVRNVRTDKFSRQLHPAGRTFQALRWTNFSAL